MNTHRVFADLHVHSTASDGVLPPRELIRLASEAGLSVLGLTDHDTLRGIPEAQAAALETGIGVVPGIELSCGWPDREFSLHVVGLFLDTQAPSLVGLLDRQQRSRFKRALTILDRLEGLGIQMQPLRERFLSETDRVLGRPHVARYLQETGVTKDFQEAFSRFLARGRPAYVPKEHVLPEDGIKAIQGAGGLAFIAHPGLLSDWKQVWQVVGDLPWDGLEVFYSEHTPQHFEFFRQITQERGWGMAGGSDYHGEYGKHARRLGLFGIPEDSFRDLEARAARRKTNAQRD